MPEHASRHDVIGDAVKCADVDDRRDGHVSDGDEGALTRLLHLGPPSVWHGVCAPHAKLNGRSGPFYAPAWRSAPNECRRGQRLAAALRSGWVALARREDVAVLRGLAVFVGRAPALGCAAVLVRLSMWASAMSSAMAIGATS